MQSADTLGGWKNHYRRMRRWEERSLRLLKDLPASDFHEAIDMALAYFLWSHSLREWLINDSKIAVRELDGALAKYPVWKLCRDVANRTRHFELTKGPTDKDWSAFREYDPFSIVLEGKETHIACFYFDGKRYRITDAVLQSANMWADIVKQFGLSASA